MLSYSSKIPQNGHQPAVPPRTAIEATPRTIALGRPDEVGPVRFRLGVAMPTG